MSRNYQMHQMAIDEGRRFDAIDRAYEATEAMRREMASEAPTDDIDSVSRDLSSCEIDALMRFDLA